MVMIIRIMVLLVLLSSLAGCKSVQSESNHAAANNQQASNNQPDNNDVPVPRPKSEIAKINVQLGMAYLESGDISRAKMKLLLALKQSPESPEPWYSMAYFLEASGNKEEANKYYLKAVDLAPKRGDTHNNYGTFLCRAGQYQDSIKQFMLAANAPDYLDPAAAFENAGLCSMQASTYKQAANYFNQALLKDPGRSLSQLKLAIVEEKLGNDKRARSLLIQYLMVAPPTAESEQLSAKLARKIG